MLPRMAQRDRSGIADEVTFEVTRDDGTVDKVKGPDPEVWGTDAEREAAQARLTNKLRKAAQNDE